MGKIAAEQDDEERTEFRDRMRPISQGGIYSPEMLVFVDETHMTEGQARRKYGWALRGQPAFRRLYQTHGHNQSFSSIASMWIRGVNTVTSFKDGVNADKFIDTIVNVIIPTMNPVGQAKSVDNAAVHDKDAHAVLCAEANIGLLFLPPYSYDDNPIESILQTIRLLFHMAKEYTRKHHRESDDDTVMTEFEETLFGTAAPPTKRAICFRIASLKSHMSSERTQTTLCRPLV